MHSKSRALLSVAAAVMAATTAAAAGTLAGEDLARQNNCLGCHQVQEKRVGPAFAAIAQRYTGQEGAADYLAHSIRNGGRGRWGAIPMPVQPQVDEAEARDLAAWILGLAGKQ